MSLAARKCLKVVTIQYLIANTGAAASLVTSNWSLVTARRGRVCCARVTRKILLLTCLLI